MVYDMLYPSLHELVAARESGNILFPIPKYCFNTHLYLYLHLHFILVTILILISLRLFFIAQDLRVDLPQS